MSEFHTPKKQKTTDGPTTPWKTPSSKGSSVSIEGWLILVGFEVVSQSNNVYFDIIVQRAKSDIVSVRVMTKNILKREDFLKNALDDEASIQLNDVFKTEDVFFYNPTNGSTHQFVTKSSLKFKKLSFKNFTQNLDNPSPNGKLNIECRAKYIGDPTFAQNGSRIRNAVLYDDSDALLITFWNPTFFNLPEDKMMYITDLTLEEYFGLKLKMSKGTIMMESGGNLVPTITQGKLTPFRIRAMGVSNPSEIQVEGIVGAFITCTIPCPKKFCPGEILPPASGKMGRCSNTQDAANKCQQMVHIDRAKHVISGQVTVTDDLTLDVDEGTIDAIFGNGVAKAYKASPDSLAEKFLNLDNPTITYDKKSSKMLAVDAPT